MLWITGTMRPGGHSARVVGYAVAIGRAMGLRNEETDPTGLGRSFT